MISHTEPIDASFDSSYPEGGLLKCIGISPRFTPNANTQTSSKLNNTKHKILSKIQLKRKSMTVAAQRQITFSKPTDGKKSHMSRISAGFFVNSPSQVNIMNSHTDTKNRKKSQGYCNCEKSKSKSKSEPHIVLRQICSSQGKRKILKNQITQTSNHIQKILKIKDQLRKYHHASRQFQLNQRELSPKINHHSSFSDPRSIDFSSGRKQDSQLRQQRFKLIKSFKKAHLLKRKLSSRLECSPLFLVKPDNVHPFVFPLIGSQNSAHAFMVEKDCLRKQQNSQRLI